MPPTPTIPTPAAITTVVPRPGAPMAITMGDPSGIGPEIVLRRAASGGLARTVVYGDLAILQHGCDLLGLDVPLHAISGPHEADPECCSVVDLGLLSAAQHRPGVLDGPSGEIGRAHV